MYVMKDDPVWHGLVLSRLYEFMYSVQVCQWQWQGRVRNVWCGVKVWCWCCCHDLLYRLKSGGGEGKCDEHSLSRSGDFGDGWVCRDAGFVLGARWSFMLHGLRGIKGCMDLLGSCRYEHVLYLIPSLCEGVLVDQGIEDTPSAGMRSVGSGKGSGAC